MKSEALRRPRFPNAQPPRKTAFPEGGRGRAIWAAASRQLEFAPGALSLVLTAPEVAGSRGPGGEWWCCCLSWRRDRARDELEGAVGPYPRAVAPGRRRPVAAPFELTSPGGVTEVTPGLLFFHHPSHDPRRGALRLGAGTEPGPWGPLRGAGEGHVPGHDEALWCYSTRRFGVPHHPHPRRCFQPGVLPWRVRRREGLLGARRRVAFGCLGLLVCVAACTS